MTLKNAGSFRPGEDHARAKLTREDALKAREMMLNGQPKGKVARLFGVSRFAMWALAVGRTWGHLEVDASGQPD